MSGNCYEAAANLLVEKLGPRATLVHADVWGEDVGWHGHAWCELDDVAYDVSNGHDIAWPTVVYRSLGRVQNIQVFSFDQALEMLVSSGHYGPW